MLPSLYNNVKIIVLFMSHHFHWETITMYRTLECFDELPPPCSDGIHGFAKMLALVWQMKHYDCNDLGAGISIWMEMVQGHPTDRYFVLPNVLVKDITKQMRHGALIILCDGCAVSWDGALIRHCTSIRASKILNWVASIHSMWFKIEESGRNG